MGLGLQLFALRRDGTEFPVDIALAPIRTPKGLLVVSFIRDLSARRKLEAALAEVEERLEHLARGKGGQLGSLVECDTTGAIEAGGVLGRTHRHQLPHGGRLIQPFAPRAVAHGPLEVRRDAEGACSCLAAAPRGHCPT